MQVQLIFTYILGYSRKNPNGGGEVEDILFWKPPWNFSYFYFIPALEIPNKTAQLRDIPQNYVRSLENSKAKKKTPGNSTLFFLGHPWKFHFVFH